LTLPLNHQEKGTGGYVVTVAINNKMLVNSRLIFWGINDWF
jgi:hypothetical protein